MQIYTPQICEEILTTVNVHGMFSWQFLFDRAPRGGVVPHSPIPHWPDNRWVLRFTGPTIHYRQSYINPLTHWSYTPLFLFVTMFEKKCLESCWLYDLLVLTLMGSTPHRSHWRPIGRTGFSPGDVGPIGLTIQSSDGPLVVQIRAKMCYSSLVIHAIGLKIHWS